MEALTLDSIDIIDPDLYVERGYPHQEWALLRDQAPVFWYQRDNVEPFWAITKHADIITVSRQPELFRSTQRLFMAIIEPDTPPPDTALLRQLLNMNPPEHGTYRSVVSRRFTPQAVTNGQVVRHRMIVSAGSLSSQAKHRRTTWLRQHCEQALSKSCGLGRSCGTGKCPTSRSCQSRKPPARATADWHLCSGKQNRCWQTTDADISRTFSRHHVWKTCEQPFISASSRRAARPFAAGMTRAVRGQGSLDDSPSPGQRPRRR